MSKRAIWTRRGRFISLPALFRSVSRGSCFCAFLSTRLDLCLCGEWWEGEAGWEWMADCYETDRLNFCYEDRMCSCL